MYAYFMGLVHKISIEVLLGLQPAWPNLVNKCLVIPGQQVPGYTWSTSAWLYLVTRNRSRTFRGRTQIVLGVQAGLVIHGLGRKKEAGCGRALVS